MPLNNFGLGYCTDDLNCLFRSAQPDDNGYRFCSAILDVKTVISLNHATADADYKLASSYGMTPLVFYLLPWFYDVDLVMKIATVIYGRLKLGHVLVHCQYGRDRTGLIVGACQLMFWGKTMNDVDQERAMFGVTGIQVLLDFEMEKMLQEIATRVKSGSPSP